MEKTLIPEFDSILFKKMTKTKMPPAVDSILFKKKTKTKMPRAASWPFDAGFCLSRIILAYGGELFRKMTKTKMPRAASWPFRAGFCLSRVILACPVFFNMFSITYSKHLAQRPALDVCAGREAKEDFVAFSILRFLLTSPTPARRGGRQWNEGKVVMCMTPYCRLFEPY